MWHVCRYLITYLSFNITNDIFFGWQFLSLIWLNQWWKRCHAQIMLFCRCRMLERTKTWAPAFRQYCRILNNKMFSLAKSKFVLHYNYLRQVFLDLFKSRPPFGGPHNFNLHFRGLSSIYSGTLRSFKDTLGRNHFCRLNLRQLKYYPKSTTKFGHLSKVMNKWIELNWIE